MDKQELQYLLLDLLHNHFQGEGETPAAFVGVQGDNLIVMQAGGEHLGIAIVPAKAEVPA